MFFIVKILLVTTVVFSAAESSSDTNHFLKNGRLMAFNKKVSYYEAKQLCLDKNMQLLSIQSIRKNKEVYNLIKGNSTTFWVSGNKITDSHVWSWLKEELVQYTSWNTGEPNNGRGDEYCIEVFANSKEVRWNDQSCQDKRPFICEKFSDHVMYPECYDYSEDLIQGSTLEQKKYYVGKENITQSTAVQLCKSMCMELVSIEDEKKNKDLFEALKDANNTDIFWSSGHFKPNDVWQWNNGKTANFFSWRESEEPNNARGNEYCIEINKNQKTIVWNDQPCEDRRMYICETTD